MKTIKLRLEYVGANDAPPCELTGRKYVWRVWREARVCGSHWDSKRRKTVRTAGPQWAFDDGEGRDFAPADFAFATDTAGEDQNAFLGELLACDECSLYVTHPDYCRRIWISLVLGNSPGELVSDYTVPNVASVAELLDNVMRAHSEKWEGREQPRILSRQGRDARRNRGLRCALRVCQLTQP